MLVEIEAVDLEGGAEVGQFIERVVQRGVVEMMGGAAMLRALLLPDVELDNDWGAGILAILEHGVLVD